MLFKEIKTTSDLEYVIKASHEMPMLLFKHSQRCKKSTNRAAYLVSFFKELPQAIQDFGHIPTIEVMTARQASNEAEAKLNVIHASPQLILIYKGESVGYWNEYNILVSKVNEICNKIKEQETAEENEEG